MSVFYRHGSWFCQSLDEFGLVTGIGPTRDLAIKAWQAMKRRAEEHMRAG